MKQVSNVFAAQQALSGFQFLRFQPKKYRRKNSDISAIKHGEKLTNHAYQEAKKVNNRVVQVAQAIPAYAKKLEKRDKLDALKIQRQLQPGKLDPIP